MKSTRLRSIPVGILLSFIFILPAPAQKISKAQDSFTFAFITDIHLEYSKSTLQNFGLVIEKLNKLNPDLIITGGDNVKDARQQSESYADSLYNLYLSQVKRFNIPVYSGIGNHEVFGWNNPQISPENPLYGKKMFESRLGKCYYSFTHKGWKFFMIDDIKNTESGQKYIGNIDDEQMQWLKSELAATEAGTPLVVCAHIPFISSMKKFEFGSLSGTPVNDGVSNSIEFFKLFENHNLKLVLQGHFHFFEVLYANNIYYITSPAPKAGMFLFETKRDSLTWKFIKNN